MKQPLVSVNIPTYNSEKTIEETLFHVLTQSYKNIEIVIVDSYSDDKTLEILDLYDLKIAMCSVKVVMCKGKLLESRIAGVKASKGKYVLLLDSDQILERTAIERAVDKMNSYDC